MTQIYSRGLVERILSDRKLLISLPKGGSIEGPNFGVFEVGQEVAFTLDSSGLQIRTLMPVELAAFYESVEDNELMFLSLQESNYGSLRDYTGERPIVEINTDLGLPEFGDRDLLWENHPDDRDLHPDPDGTPC